MGLDRDGSGPVLQFLPPMPLDLYVALGEAIAATCEAAGYDAYFTHEDGLGVVHVRQRDPS